MSSARIRDFPGTGGISREIDTGWISPGSAGIGDGGGGCVTDAGTRI